MPKLKDQQDADQQYDPYSNDYARDLLREDNETGKNAGVAAGIDQAEAFANDPANASKKALGEESDVTNRFNFSQPDKAKTPNKTLKARLKNFAKKKGPFAFLGGGLAGILALIAFFGGPSMLLVHMSEIFGDKLDQQNIVLDKRYRKISLAKFENNTRGLCSNAVSFRCKYGSFSNRELRAMHKNGISVVGADGKPFVDKDGKVTRERGTRAASIQFDGKTITPQGYQRELRTNPSFRTASILSANTKFIGLSDKLSARFFARAKASKARPFKQGATDEERKETVITNTKEGVKKATPPVRPPDCTATCEQQFQEEQRRYNEAAALGEKADEFAKDNVRTSKPGMMSKVVSTVNVAGAADDACLVAGTINGIGFGAKIVRNQQMIRYAMMFLTTASMIKAGDATPEDVEYLGNIATKTTVDEETGETTKAATDSFAFRSVAYGDTGLTESAMFALGAGGLGAGLQGLAGDIYKLIPGGKGTCKTLNNPVVQSVGILATFIPGAGAAGKATSVTFKTTIQLAIKNLIKKSAVVVAENKVMSVFLGYLINIGIDIVSGAGANPDTMYGEQAGDWIGSGTDAMFSGMNGMGGALPLTPAQAVAQAGESRQIAAEYNRAEGKDVSPFDTTNPNSFIGSVYQNVLLRSSGSFSSLPSSLSSIGNLVTSTLAGAGVSKTHASESDFTKCEDYTYRDIANNGENQVATSPLCHVTRGIPAPYIDLDPLVVSEDLLAKNQIDETGAPVGQDYKEFIDLCFSDKLVNETDIDGAGDDGKCQIRDSDSQAEKDRKGYYAVHYVDERLSEVAENGLPKSGAQQPAERADTSTEFAWPLDKKYFTQDPEDWLGPHLATSGTYTNGIDSLASDIGNPPDGSPVYAMYGGRVTRPDLGGHGLVITSEVQGGKLEIAYAHGPRASDSSAYKTGDKIMEVGCLGNCSGGHLHVDMAFNDKPVCPQDVFVAFNKGVSPNFAELTKTAKAPCGRGRDGAV